jgi:hypothetical protein
MPEEEAAERAREDEREGKSPSTQAGEFVREEMEHIREGEHGARSPEQAIAIGLSKARRAGVELPPPKRGKKKTKRQAKRDLSKEAFVGTISCNQRCPQARKRPVSVKESAIATREACCGSTLGAFAIGGSEESCTETKTSPLGQQTNSTGTRERVR